MLAIHKNVDVFPRTRLNFEDACLLTELQTIHKTVGLFPRARLNVPKCMRETSMPITDINLPSRLTAFYSKHIHLYIISQTHCNLIILKYDNSRHVKFHEKVQVGKDQEKAQSEKDSHSKNRGGKKPN